MPPPLDIQIRDTHIVLPYKPVIKPTTTPLSILDNNCARFSRCAAIWYYYPPIDSSSQFNQTTLLTALSHTLNFYRPWCGRLSYTTPPLTTYGPQSTRYQRLSITYNTSNDLGIPCTFASSPHQLADFLPPLHSRRTSSKAWSAADDIDSSSLLPSTPLSLSSSACSETAPNVLIQVTTFACGSVAMGIAITHCLADALSLSRFANDWATLHRSSLLEVGVGYYKETGLPPPNPPPIFNPQMLDAYAAGDINGPPNDELRRKARGLPQHRYDWYTPVEGQPWPNPKPQDFDDVIEAMEDVGAVLGPTTPIPWSQWDTRCSVSHRILHFSREEILSIFNTASSTSTSSTPSNRKIEAVTELKISKHDALLAHLWSEIIISRCLPEGTTSYLDVTFGIRARVEPPLPDEYLGSPIMHVAVPSTSLGESRTFAATSSLASRMDKSSMDVVCAARQIRAHLSKFGNEEISCILHERASELAPQRIWGTCLGREHVLLTTWVHSGVHNVEFLNGCKAVHIEAVVSIPSSVSWLSSERELQTPRG